LEAEKVQALGVLRSLQSKKRRGAQKQSETHCLSNEETGKSIENHVEKETARARKRVEDAKPAIRQELEDTEAAENAGLTTRELEKT